MAELVEGVIRGQRRRTTMPEPSPPRPPDLVDRDFTASRPDQLWVADMTYVRTWTGWVYVAFVLDVFSRTIVGWQVANHMRTELPLDALEMALWRRRIKKDSGLIHHSDRGSQYVSIRYTDRLADIGAAASVGSVADSYDNAMAEALNGTFKAELIEMQMAGLRPGRAGDLPVGRLVQRGTAPLRPRLRTARRVRTQLVATAGGHPAVRLKQDHRTPRNSGQLSRPRHRALGAGPGRRGDGRGSCRARSTLSPRLSTNQQHTRSAATPYGNHHSSERQLRDEPP
jgi:hypothetical protein